MDCLEFFQSWESPVKLIVMNSVESLQATAHIIQSLKIQGFSLTTYQQFPSMETIANEKYDHYVFVGFAPHFDTTDLPSYIVLGGKTVSHDHQMIGNMLDNAKLLAMNTKITEISAELVESACRMNKSSAAIAAYLGDAIAQKELQIIHSNCKIAIQQIVYWYDQNKSGEAVEDHETYSILKLQDDFRSEIIGAAAEKIAEATGKAILAVAYTHDGTMKISLRSAYAFSALEPIIRKLGGTIGGADSIAGANIAKEHEEEFITLMRGVLPQQAYEEPVS